MKKKSLFHQLVLEKSNFSSTSLVPWGLMNYPWGSVRFAWGIHCPVLLCPYVAPWVSQSVRIRPRYRVFIATKIWYFKQNCNFKFELLYGVILWRIKCLTRNSIPTALKNNNMPCHTIQYIVFWWDSSHELPCKIWSL